LRLEPSQAQAKYLMSKIEAAKATPGSTKKSGESGAPPPTRVPQEPQA